MPSSSTAPGGALRVTASRVGVTKKGRPHQQRARRNTVARSEAQVGSASSSFKRSPPVELGMFGFDFGGGEGDEDVDVRQPKRKR